MANISLIDYPVKALKKADGTTNDVLETESYARALSKFAIECGTPMTIGVQGEWGSGKTSLLNMIQDVIENEQVKNPGRSNSTLGIDSYKIIWVNTWEHSILKTPEESLLSILEEIINAISEIDGSWKTAQKAKSALSFLAKGAMRIGTAAALGKEAADELGNSLNGENSIRTLRMALEHTIKELINREKNPIKRFIIFIDDLDRLEPSVAVMVLELLKNIFNIENCVFVLAIDYQVVVKGLKNKFGEPNEHNEWEFRAFFDKIIQLPFMMPMGAYNLDKYFDSLLEETAYFSKSEMNKLKSNNLSKIIKLTIGTNPRALKRLVNSLSLILIQRNFKIENDKDISDNEIVTKQLLITFVCIQISYPKLYNLILKSPIFYQWDNEYVYRVTDNKNTQLQDTENALQKIIELQEEDFDETWEQALFKILWSNNWHKNKIIEISRALSIVKNKILLIISADELKEKILKKALKLTAVTSVSTLEEDKTEIQDEDDEKKAYRISYWKDFTNIMKSTNSSLSYDKKSSTYCSWNSHYNQEDLFDANIEFIFSVSAKSMVRIKTKTTINQTESYNFFKFLKSYADEFEKITTIKPIFKIKEDQDYQMIQFLKFDDCYGDLSLQENLKKKEKVFEWLRKNVELIENIMKKAYTEFSNKENNK